MERVVEYTLRAQEDIAFFKKGGQANVLKKSVNLLNQLNKALLRISESQSR